MASPIRLEDKPFSLFFVLLSVLMGCYLALRAIYNPLVFDEATTFFLYVKSGAFWPGEGYWSANNHFLNSGLSWLSYQALGAKEWVLRLPSLLSFIFFCYWLWALLNILNTRWIKIAAALIIFGSHYWMEFFAYSRGYGWAFAFITGSLLYLYQFWKSGVFRHFAYLWICLALLVFSNLSALPLVALIIVTAAYLLVKKNIATAERIAGGLLLFLPLIFGIWHARQLKMRDQLYYGGRDGFWTDSIQSLQQVFFNAEGGLAQLPFTFMGLSLLAAGIVFMVKKPRPEFFPRIIPLIYFFVILVFYLLAPLIINLKYPFDRALLYWFFLGILALVSLVDYFWHQKNKWAVLLLLPLLVFPATFAKATNLQHSSADNWSREQIPDRFYQQVAEADIRSSVGGYYLREPQWQFLEVKSEPDLNFYQSTQRTSQALDFVLAEVGQLDNYQQHYVKLDSNAANNLFLLQRNIRLQRKLHQRKALANRSATREGIKLENYPWPRPLLTAFSLTGEIKIREFPFTAVIGIQGRDAKGETVFFKDLRFNRYLKQTEIWQNFRLFVVLDDIPAGVENLEVFFWNKDEQEYSLRRAVKSTWHLTDYSEKRQLKPRQ